MSAVQEVGLTSESKARYQAEERRRAWERFAAAVAKFEAMPRAKQYQKTMVTITKQYLANEDTPETAYTVVTSDWHFLAWDEVERAYRALRLLYIPYRKGKGRVGKRYDPTLDTWTSNRAKFLNRFYGIQELDGSKRVRRFKGVPEPIAEVIRRYQALQRKWHQKSHGYLKKKRARQRLWAQENMVNTSPAGKAAKAKYAASPKGIAAAELKRDLRKVKDRARRAAKKKAGAK